MLLRSDGDVRHVFPTLLCIHLRVICTRRSRGLSETKRDCTVVSKLYSRKGGQTFSQSISRAGAKIRLEASIVDISQPKFKFRLMNLCVCCQCFARFFNNREIFMDSDKGKTGRSFFRNIFLFLLFIGISQNALADDLYVGPPYSVYYGGRDKLASFSSRQEAIDWASKELSYDGDPWCRIVAKDANPFYGSPVRIYYEDSEGYDCALGGFFVYARPYERDSIRKSLGDPCCNAVGNPINAGTGNKYQKETDFNLSEELQLVRYYNSSEQRIDAYFGDSWRHTYDRRMDYASGNREDGSFVESAVFIRQDGKILSFFREDGHWIPETGVQDRLVDIKAEDGSVMGWEFYDANNRVEEFYDLKGFLRAIDYLDGRKTTLSYGPTKYGTAERLLSVQDSSGRKISFAYDYLLRVSSISLPDGEVVKYSYDGGVCDYSMGRLVKVTYPDSSTRKYEYNSDTRCRAGYGDAYLTGIVDESDSKFATFAYESEDEAPSWQYDSYGSRRATLSMHGDGAEKHEFAYLNDESVRITYPEGVSALLNFINYKGNIRLSSVSEPCNPACKQNAQLLNYDDRGYATSSSDFNGNTRTTEFDDEGLLLKQVDAQGTPSERVIAFTWDKTLRRPLSRVTRDAGGLIAESIVLGI